jgi:MFS family permease
VYLRLLRENRDFRLLYFATLISLGGDWFLTVALLDLVLQLTGSATLVSLVLLTQTLPIFFFTPHAGHLIDRVDRRKLMIAVDLLRIVACLLPLLARTPALLPFAYAGIFLISVGSAYFEPASQAALPNIVKPEDLATANVLMGSTWGTMLTAGAALGGAVTAAFGRDVAFVVDAISFALSAWLLTRMRVRFSEERDPAEAAHAVPFLASIGETIAFARSQPRVLGLLTVKTGYGLGAGVVAMLGVFGKEVFRAGAWGIGLLFAARGLGALFGPFLLRGAIRSDEARYRAIAFCVFAFGAGYAALAISKTLAAGFAAILFAHLGGGAAWQISTYGLQRETPDAIRGRVFAADYGFVTLTMACSGLASGIAADRYGPTAGTLGVASVCLLFAVVWALATYKLWRRVPRV